MHAEQIKHHLDAYKGDPLRVRLTYVDLTYGETTEAYFVEGQRGVFPSIHAFVAEALISIEHHMTAEQASSYSQSAWSTLEAFSCEPASWMERYNPIVQPGEVLCFPNANAFGFQPPMDLERKIYLIPHFSGTEECLATQNAEIFVLLYWHTTG